MAAWARSADGTNLAVYERGGGTPTVVCVHGYPDDHTVWDGVVEELAGRYRVVTYDVRGAGRSDVPRDRAAYRLDRLEDDLLAVLDAVSPDQPVHLLAHDWGSIQAWHAVTGSRLDGRVASYTSISGPCLDHAGLWMRSQLRPSPRRLGKLVKQVLFSGYIAFFQLPRLPELAWRRGAVTALLRVLQPGEPPKPRIADGVHGLELYRANMMPRFRRPAVRTTGIPVQVIAPAGDPFVGTPVQTEIAGWVPELRVHRVSGGHWLPRTHPGLVARLVRALVEESGIITG
jgi:pimeloyl-ACP methyl ester carboxylesterase